MPVGIGIGRRADLRPGAMRSLRFAGADGVHAGALWLAAIVPALATLLLLTRLAS